MLQCWTKVDISEGKTFSDKVIPKGQQLDFGSTYQGEGLCVIFMRFKGSGLRYIFQEESLLKIRQKGDRYSRWVLPCQAGEATGIRLGW